MYEPSPKEKAAWEKIAKAADQPAEYYRWCREIAADYEAGRISLEEATGMLTPSDPKTFKQFGQLDKNADVQFIMTYADSIYGTVDYMDKVLLDEDWARIVKIVKRHSG
jgi:hypothetical protein